MQKGRRLGGSGALSLCCRKVQLPDESSKSNEIEDGDDDDDGAYQPNDAVHDLLLCDVGKLNVNRVQKVPAQVAGTNALQQG
jgi:hypothetical protein